uniref:(northern house mosquito) hypothetical protein n=1 Tax=Culex pipiens TaxID=7175 RepID=A0A8D8NB94_CULPI
MLIPFYSLFFILKIHRIIFMFSEGKKKPRKSLSDKITFLYFLLRLHSFALIDHTRKRWESKQAKQKRGTFAGERDSFFALFKKSCCEEPKKGSLKWIFF